MRLMFRRTARISDAPMPTSSCPMNSTEPSVGRSSWMIARAVVVFPDPLSPTMPSVSPGFTAKETPLTARTCPTTRWKMNPRVMGKCTCRSATDSSGPAAKLTAASARE